MNVQDIFQQASQSTSHKSFRDLFEKIAKLPNSQDVLVEVLELALERKDANAMSFSNVANGLFIKERSLRSTDIAKRIVGAQWSSASEDAIGVFQSIGTADDIPFLKKQAEISAPTWFERDDENQSFFRKCVWAISRIGVRSRCEATANAALNDLALNASHVASFWAKKQLNHDLSSASPFANEELTVQPDPDWEWPGNEKLSVLRHPIYANHDKDTITVYQAYSDEIGKAAAIKGSLDVKGFSKSRMTWIKPSFNWMMYRSGWGQKDERQTTILRLKLLRPEFFHLIQNSALSHCPPKGSEDWKSELQIYPNRVQWDPDRDVIGNPVKRRAFQLGISPDFMEFYLHQAIAEIEDITSFCADLHKDLDTIPAGPQERIFWTAA